LTAHEEPEDPEANATAAVATASGLPDHFYDLYALSVEMADRVSARRGNANSFFLTVNTGLVALVGSTSPRWYVAAAGIVFSGTWLVLLRSYRKLNEAKFAVIIEMEHRLPHGIFGDEYDHYRKSPNRSETQRTRRGRMLSRTSSWAAKYRELGEVERVVPIVFAAIYSVEIIRQIAA